MTTLGLLPPVVDENGDVLVDGGYVLGLSQPCLLLPFFDCLSALLVTRTRGSGNKYVTGRPKTDEPFPSQSQLPEPGAGGCAATRFERGHRDSRRRRG